ncbi:MAG: deoxynucleoside kinase [Candidatus Cloacimonetes bacterium]|jgi:deoxyadenosine/deoxycytidine kinase|nr:deoxynucleoside kinase [Candidatus Cloacimonadota bacterium]MDD2507371.1 deoxynucleoside kinase [Candidatus Cloacimonadota bacterium]MDD4147163.1 deoxynucleoside kinase [Candidatus Cloacimonadota bacterium]MDD4560774.1 deoxynucleoside kinase [Candidatus Cloacimonadota bacterium]
MENICIGIVGNIGVGKSTFIEAASTAPLSKTLISVYPKAHGTEGVYAFPERFNPIVLDSFYKDPVANAFMAQIEFFNGRLDRQRLIHSCRGIVLEDRTLAEDYHIFGKAQRILQNMSEPEFIAYQRTYRLMTEQIKEPDLLVYFRADVPTLLDRIKERGRESELSISADYLNLLNNLYEDFIAHHVSCPVLIVDADTAIEKSKWQRRTLNLIAEQIKSLGLRVCSPGISEWVSLPQTEATLKAIDAERNLEQYLAEHPKLIAIAGNVGLGKSTLTAIMGRSLKISCLYEKPEENPLLEKFLGNKKAHCYDLQLHFLEMRAQQRRQGKSGQMSYVKDRSLPEDLLVFCNQFHADGLLTEDELDNLSTQFQTVNRDLPSSDLIILLHGSPSLAWERIQQRGRDMEIEGGWQFSEIKNLSRWYKDYSTNVVKLGFHDGPVLEIDVEKLDLTNRIHVGYIFESVLEILSAQD